MEGESHRSTLGDYFTLQRGTTYKSRLLGQSGPVLLGLATIQHNGGFRSDSLQTYGGDSPDKLLVQPGDLYVSLKDVTQSADVLTPGRYAGAKAVEDDGEPFAEKMQRLTATLREQQAEAARLDAAIAANLQELGYGG